MKIKYNEELKKYTTLKIGGVAENFYEIESLDDIREITKNIGENYYIIANGSNVLINDRRKFENVLYMNTYKKIIKNNCGIIEVSSSVKMQELINFINKNDFGGIEYLYSVPATVGGAICMNAGRGRNHNKSISDYVVDVTFFDGREVKTVEKEDCKFDYRDSIFKNRKFIILSARFKFEYISKQISSNAKAERIHYSKKNLDANNSNAGSVFRISNGRIMNFLRRLGLGWKKGVSFSKKTSNWINNNGNGTYRQARILINIAVILHKILGKEVSLEYILWD